MVSYDYLTVVRQRLMERWSSIEVVELAGEADDACIAISRRISRPEGEEHYRYRYPLSDPELGFGNDPEKVAFLIAIDMETVKPDGLVGHD